MGLRDGVWDKLIVYNLDGKIDFSFEDKDEFINTERL